MKTLLVVLLLALSASAQDQLSISPTATSLVLQNSCYHLSADQQGFSITVSYDNQCAYQGHVNGVVDLDIPGDVTMTSLAQGDFFVASGNAQPFIRFYSDHAWDGNIWADGWGSLHLASNAEVPEPLSWILILTGVAMILRRKEAK